MYVCGPTVYDYAHIGNARPVVVFDVLYRLLMHLYGTVTYVRNITDVDDKINARAAENKEDIRNITKRMIQVFHEDMAALGTLIPSIEPRATEHIDEMIKLIGCLLETNHAYTAEEHVLFDVPSMKKYGRLSRRNREEMIAGARIEIASCKKDPADFVLWKPSNKGEPGWDSPWGYGRPGWHLECSAMSSKYLGTTFDIHGGGQDLIFPHHENEIAQNLCSYPGSHFARYWIHNGYLLAEGEKMSKSLGNFYTVRDLLSEFPGEAIRLTLLQTHYRRPLDFTKNNITRARRILNRFYSALRGLNVEDTIEKPPTEVIETLEDDINTPKTISLLYQILNDLNKAEGKEKTTLAKSLLATGKMIGLLQQNPEAWFEWAPQSSVDKFDVTTIESLITQRLKARKNKNFSTADKIRDDLKKAGIFLEDNADGTIWRRE